MSMIKTKLCMIVSFVVLGAIAAPSASAQVRVFTLDVPATIPSPLSGFSVNYTLGGSSFFASAQLHIYLSTTRDGSSGLAQIDSRQILLRCGGTGPCLPPLGTQTAFISPLTNPSVRAVLQSIDDACQPLSLFVLADVDFSPLSIPGPTTMGTTKLPDFMFTGGTISPTAISPGGTTRISFDLFTRCPANAPSRVGIFLADAAFNLLGAIGVVPITAGAGTFSLPPSAITFSPTVTPGSYNIVLIADVDGFITESNESNNVGAFALTIVPAALAQAVGAVGPLDRDVAIDGVDLPRALALAPVGRLTR